MRRARGREKQMVSVTHLNTHLTHMNGISRQRRISQADHGGIVGAWLTPRPKAASEMLVRCIQARSEKPAVRIKREREREGAGERWQRKAVRREGLES